MIISISEIEKVEDMVSVIALIEDAALIYPQTYLDPPEYGEAFCEASFCIDEDGKLPEDEKKLVEYLELLNLDWQVLPKDWDY